MSKITRSDVFTRSEKGGEWFDEFLRICHDQKQVLEAVVNKKSEGVAEVVQQYRDMVGLDLVKNAGNDTKVETTKVAKSTFLSIRQAQSTIVAVLESNPEIKSMIDSFCEHSGGTKNTHSIINYLREKLGNDLVRFSDKDLVNYIEERKKHYKEHISEDASVLDVGKTGTEPSEHYEDHVADYITHGK